LPTFDNTKNLTQGICVNVFKQNIGDFMKLLFTKTLLSVGILGVFGFSHANASLAMPTFQCTSKTKAGDEVEMTATLYVRAKKAAINLKIGDQSYSGFEKFQNWDYNTEGSSRCPGHWGGIAFTSLNGAPIVKKISITTDIYSSSGCGLGPSDSLTIEQDGNEESVHLKCTDL
jgi:hypothetical protein